jgi:acetate kinase
MKLAIGDGQDENQSWREMKILALNSGSGSEKVTLFQIEGTLPSEPPEPLWQASIDSTAPDQPPGKLVVEFQTRDHAGESYNIPADSSPGERITQLLRTLRDDARVLRKPVEINAIGHRVVHGGAEYSRAVRVDEKVERDIERFAAFAPLHNEHNLEGIRVARKVLGSNTPHVAVFDTAFHRTLPDAAAIYAGPYAWIGRGIRRYGFHGTSFRWAASRAAQLLGRKDDPELKLILCHLGGGCSLAVTIGGRSVDTTMGFTPLDGIAMSTRSGALDPGILLYLLRQGMTVDDLEKTLNKESGLKGLSGLVGDTRVVLPAAKNGNGRARLAIDVFIHRLRAGIGQMLAALGRRPDALIFTGAIGESEPDIRAAACEAFAFLGLQVDREANAASRADSDIAAANSSIRVLIIKTQENWQIVRECAELLSQP